MPDNSTHSNGNVHTQNKTNTFGKVIGLLILILLLLFILANTKDIRKKFVGSNLPSQAKSEDSKLVSNGEEQKVKSGRELNRIPLLGSKVNKPSSTTKRNFIPNFSTTSSNNNKKIQQKGNKDNNEKEIVRKPVISSTIQQQKKPPLTNHPLSLTQPLTLPPILELNKKLKNPIISKKVETKKQEVKKVRKEVEGVTIGSTLQPITFRITKFPKKPKIVYKPGREGTDQFRKKTGQRKLKVSFNLGTESDQVFWDHPEGENVHARTLRIQKDIAPDMQAGIFITCARYPTDPFILISNLKGQLLGIRNVILWHEEFPQIPSRFNGSKCSFEPSVNLCSSLNSTAIVAVLRCAYPREGFMKMKARDQMLRHGWVVVWDFTRDTLEVVSDYEMFHHAIEAYPLAPLSMLRRLGEGGRIPLGPGLSACKEKNIQKCKFLDSSIHSKGIDMAMHPSSFFFVPTMFHRDKKCKEGKFSTSPGFEMRRNKIGGKKLGEEEEVKVHSTIIEGMGVGAYPLQVPKEWQDPSFDPPIEQRISKEGEILLGCLLPLKDQEISVPLWKIPELGLEKPFSRHTTRYINHCCQNKGTQCDILHCNTLWWEPVDQTVWVYSRRSSILGVFDLKPSKFLLKGKGINLKVGEEKAIRGRKRKGIVI